MNEFATSFLVVATSIRAIFTHLRAFYVPAYTQGEVASQNLWSRYDRHFVGITRYSAST